MERRRTSVFALVLVLIAGTVAAVYSGWPPGAAARRSPIPDEPPPLARSDSTTIIPLDIQIYANMSRTDVDVRRILESVAIVMKKDGQVVGDVFCDVQFVPENVSHFQGSFDGIVSNRDEFNSLFGTASLAGGGTRVRQVRAVWGFTWCQYDGVSNVAGCSDQDGFRVAVKPVSPAREGPLWAHEVGHTKNLIHRPDPGAVMMPTIFSDSTELNSGECTKFQKRGR